MGRRPLQSDVLLVGYYGQRNTGDDALLAVAAGFCRQSFATGRIFATIREPIRSYEVTVEPILAPFRCRGVGIVDRLLTLRHGRHLTRVVFGGGSVFHSAESIRSWTVPPASHQARPTLCTGSLGGTVSRSGGARRLVESYSGNWILSVCGTVSVLIGPSHCAPLSGRIDL